MILLRDLLIGLFGEYTPNLDASGVPLAGLAGVDWVWISSVALFSLVLYGLLRFVGVIFKR